MVIDVNCNYCGNLLAIYTYEKYKHLRSIFRNQVIIAIFSSNLHDQHRAHTPEPEIKSCTLSQLSQPGTPVIAILD